MSQGYEFDFTDVPDTEAAAGSDFVPPEEGVYHVAISKVNMEPVKKNGEAVNGLELSFEVLAGTVDGQAGKTFREAFTWPSPMHKDGGQFARRRLTRLGLVTGVVSPGSLGKPGVVAWPDMAARHFIATIKHREWTGDKEGYSAEIAGMDFWHVASAEVGNIPKDAEALEMVPMGADPFSGAKSGGDGRTAGNGNGSPSPAPTPKPAPAAAKRTRAARAPAAAVAPTAQAATASTIAPSTIAASTTTADPYADL